jgi:glucosamine--fructose-6-phosphate aminotransferase (isomerizing)
MCGIFGYIGPRDPVPIIMGGLKSLEYRGYDSAGIAVIQAQKLEVRRCSGKLKNLEELLVKQPVTGQFGLGHRLRKTLIRTATVMAASWLLTTASSRTTSL